MRSIQRIGISVAAAFLLLAQNGYGRGANSSAPDGNSAFYYSTPNPVYIKGMQIAANNPLGGCGYAFGGALPPGLILDRNTGQITGIPTTAAAQTQYTITANNRCNRGPVSNTGGGLTAILTITVSSGGPAMACADLVHAQFPGAPPNTTIHDAVLVPANTLKYPPPYQNLKTSPEHCLVHGTTSSRTGVMAPEMDQYGNITQGSQPDGYYYEIDFELRMPTTTWNGDFYFTGGSGNDGVVNSAIGTPLGGGNKFLPALNRGFAVITQNSGHTAGKNPEFPPDPNQNNGFGYDPTARNDYGYQQTGTLTPFAKQILQKYYGTGPAHSYYIGCSNGGREAMVASQRWGSMFDGIVAGDPGYRLPSAAIAEAWDTQQFAKAAEAVTNGKDPLDKNGNPSLVAAVTQDQLNLVGQLAQSKCDALDGLADGMIFNTAVCRQQFDPSTLSQLQCKPSQNPPGCLLPEQIAAIQNVFKGPVDSKGAQLYSDWPYDVGIPDPKWMEWTVGYDGITAKNTTQGATSTMYLFTTPPNSTLNIFTAPMDQLNTGIHATYFGNTPAFENSAVQYMNADSPDLDTFRTLGGKIIYFHGESDPVFSMYDTVNYYDSLTARYGSQTPEFARLFLIPGMNHCSGGVQTLDSFDPLSAIVNWVEQGTAPDSIIAGNSNSQQLTPPVFPIPFTPGTTYSFLPINWTRPLCPYPQFAQYTGGDIANSTSFKCAAPAAEKVHASEAKHTAHQP